MKMYFDDTRHFGSVEAKNIEVLNTDLDSIGPDISVISEDEFTSRLKTKPKKQLVQALLDQFVISGIGNYLKSEILFEARIKPDKLISELSKDEFIDLFNWSKYLWFQSYRCQGCTLKTYKNTFGNPGTFNLEIYDKDFVIVDKIKYRVTRSTFKDLRTTHWIPDLQV